MIVWRASTVKKTVDYQGIKVHVDRPKGTIQSGVDESGQAWSRTYQIDYGFLPGTKGGDGEELDAFLGEDPEAPQAWMCKQSKADGSFDEHKLMLGFRSANEARLAYAAHIPEKFLREMHGIRVDSVRALRGIDPTGKAAKDMTHGSTGTQADLFYSRDSLHRPDGLCVREAVVSSVREEQREIDFICSTDSVDSYEEVVKQNWDLKRFNRNPVALFAHDRHALPIGQWKGMTAASGALCGTLKVATSAANPIAEQIWQSFKEGTLRAVSVGFIPHKVSYEDVDGKERCVLDENELYECSVVPIPANGDAIAKMRARALEERNAVTYEATPVVEGAWDAANAEKRLRKWASSDGSGSADSIDWNKYKKGFAWYDLQQSHTFAGFRLPHHDIRDGKLVTHKGGVEAAGGAIQGARGGVKIPESEIGAVKAHLAKHYKQFGAVAPWDEPAKAAAPQTEGTPKMKTKDDGDDEMMNCPKCSESIPVGGKSKKEIDAIVTRETAPHMERVVTVETRIKAVETERDASRVELTERTTERDAARKERDEAKTALQSMAFELQIDPLIGTKCAPAEKDGLVAMARHFASQADGADKWAKHLDGVKAREDMAMRTGTPVIGSEKGAPRLNQSQLQDDDSAAIASIKSFGDSPN